MEVSGRTQTDSEDVETVKTGIECDPCLLGDKPVPAEWFCTVCNEFMCRNCARTHRNSIATRNHKLLHSDEMPKEKFTTVQKFCSSHTHKQIQYFCEKDDQLCCSVCLSLEHRGCKVMYIDNIAGGFVESEEYQHLLKQIKLLEIKLTDTKKQSKKNCEDVNKCFTTLISDIQHYRLQINRKLDEIEEKIREEAQKVKTDDIKFIESILTQCKSMEKKLSEFSSNLDGLEKYKQNKQLFISSKHYLTDVKEMKHKLKELMLRNHIKRYSFQCNEDILVSLDTCCKLDVFEFQNIMYKDPKQIKAQLVKNINIQHKEDISSDCYISGSDMLTYDTLALTDKNNSSVKLVDLNTDTVTSSLLLSDKPRDLTCTDSKTLVVTSETKLTFLKFDGKLAIMKQIPMEDGCWRITSHQNKIFVTFTGRKPSVKILNSEGAVLHTIQTNSQGQNLFVEPRDIILSTDGETVYVSDWGHDTVTSYTITGEILNVYKHKSLKHPLGLALIENKFIFVCGGWSHNLHEISCSCKHIQIVLDKKDVGGFPWTVLYNRKNNMIYISYGREKTFLSVFKLE